MQKEKYINQNNQIIKNRMEKIFCVLLVVVIVILSVIALIKEGQSSPEYALETKVRTTLRDFECTFEKMQKSKEENFDYDIYLIFKHDLYEGSNSQEEFYNKVINSLAEVFEYKNFRLIDKSRTENIEIKVICSNSKVQKIYINGMEDYFIYMNSKENIQDYKEINTTQINIEAPELIECIQNGWSTSTNFGTRESIFQDYYVFFDEGIEVRKIHGKIYNVVFNNNYVKSVVNGFTVGTKRDIIESRLGKATFRNSEGTVIGYKNNDIYIFFEENQISVYRNTAETGFDEFLKLTDKFIKNEYKLLEFMNELTYIWPDYEQYYYDKNTVFVSYPNKGIDIKINYDNTNGIVLYNNVGITKEETNKCLLNTEFIADLNSDNIFNAELRRIDKRSKLNENCEQYKKKYEEKDTRNRGELYNYYMNFASNNSILNVYFISQNSSYPNCELNENIDTYIWARNDLFVYSVKQKGIYYYDLKNQTKGTLIKGNKDFKINSINNNILNYDKKDTLTINV